MYERVKILCRELDKKNSIISDFNSIKNRYEKELECVRVYFPHYSKHDVSHSINIINNIALLFGKTEIEKLSLTDLLVFILAAYTHDIGMKITYEEIKEKLVSDKKCTDDELDLVKKYAANLSNESDRTNFFEVYTNIGYQIEDLFRKEHAKRSKEIVLEDNAIKELLGTRIHKILADICESHCDNIKNILWRFESEDNGLFNDYWHPMFIAAMLSLGDLLDLDTDRFDDGIIKVISPMPDVSKNNYDKHQSVKKFRLKNGAIEIKCDTDNIEALRLMRQWISWIRENTELLALNRSKVFPEEINVVPYLSECELLYNGSNKWMEFIEAKFSISSERALELLRGTGIYSNKWEFFNEVIQNSVDATLKRLYDKFIVAKKEHDIETFLEWIKNSVNLDDYKIKANIRLQNDRVILIIIDKGVGFSVGDLRRLISNGKRNNDPYVNMPEIIKPSGCFGIGLQSIFNVADKFEAITKTKNELGKKIIFEELKNPNGYITIEDYLGINETGTQITIVFNSDKFDVSEFTVNELDQYIITKEKYIFRRFQEYFDNTHVTSPYGRDKNPLFDYIPIEVRANVEIMGVERERLFLERQSILKNINVAPNLDIENDIIKYEFFDKECNCIFKAQIHVKNNNEELLDLENDYFFNYYGKSIYFRNRFVGYFYDHELGVHRNVLVRCVDYSINLLNGSAGEILQLGRNKIRDAYKPKLRKLIYHEIRKMFEHIIDYVVDNKTQQLSSILKLIVFQATRYYNYKKDDIESMYGTHVQNIKVVNFLHKDNFTHVKLADLMNNDNVSYIVELKVDNYALMEIVPGVSEEEFDSYYKFNGDFVGNHLISYRKSNRALIKYGNKVYIKYTIKVLESNEKEYIENDKLLFHLEVINMMINEVYYIYCSKKYKDLGVNRILDNLEYQSILPFEIFVYMDDDIRSKMSQELKLKGYVENARSVYKNQIKHSQMFKKCVDIVSEKRGAVSKEAVEKTYLNLWDEILRTIEDKKFSKFTENCNNKEIQEILYMHW